MFSYATFEAIRRRSLVDGGCGMVGLDTERAGRVSAGVEHMGQWRALLCARRPRRSSAARYRRQDDADGGGADGPVAMISHRLWQRRFNGAPDVIGRSLMVERTPVTIVGVTPAWFSGVELGRPFDLFLPVKTQP